MSAFLVEAAENAEIASENDETTSVQWVKEENLKQMLETPDDFFPLQVPAWQYHFSQKAGEE